MSIETVPSFWVLFETPETMRSMRLNCADPVVLKYPFATGLETKFSLSVPSTVTGVSAREFMSDVVNSCCGDAAKTNDGTVQRTAATPMDRRIDEGRCICR